MLAISVNGRKLFCKVMGIASLHPSYRLLCASFDKMVVVTMIDTVLSVTAHSRLVLTSRAGAQALVPDARKIEFVGSIQSDLPCQSFRIST